jgi:hypothetical protein
MPPHRTEQQQPQQPQQQPQSQPQQQQPQQQQRHGHSRTASKVEAGSHVHTPVLTSLTLEQRKRAEERARAIQEMVAHSTAIMEFAQRYGAYMHVPRHLRRLETLFSIILTILTILTLNLDMPFLQPTYNVMRHNKHIRRRRSCSI